MHPSRSSSPASRMRTSEPPDDQPGKKRRVRTGCFPCRTRKIKCDEQRDTCEACRRMGLECRWPAAAASAVSFTRAPAAREASRGRLVICSACRLARARCDQARPSCERCATQDLACAYPGPERDTASPAPATPELDAAGRASPQPPSPRPHPRSPARAASATVPPLRSRCPTSPLMSPGRDTLMEINDRLPRSALLDSHINAWFRYLHPIGANGFLHRGTLLREVQEHRASKNLVVSICAAAGYFVLGAAHEVGLVPNRPLNIDSWSNHAKRSLLLDETVSLDNLATALVLHRHFIYCGRLGLADAMASHATRQASLLGLFRAAQRDTGPWHEQEHRRRLLWACLHPGPLYTAGSDDDILPRAGARVRLALPVEDYNFQLSIRCDAPLSDLGCQDVRYDATSDIVGVMGQYAIVTSCRLDAQRYAAAQLLADHDVDDFPWSPGSTYHRILQRLVDWRAHLPPRLEHASETIFARSLTGEETPLAMLHAWFHAAMWELHISWTAPADGAPVGWYDQQRATCLEHAQAFGQVLNLHDRHLPSHVFTDPSLPLLVLEAVKIQLHAAAVPPVALTELERGALGAGFDAMAKHLFRTSRLIWSSGYSIKLLGELYTRYDIPTKLDFTQGGPASKHDVPVYIKQLLRVDRDFPGHSAFGSIDGALLGTGPSIDALGPLDAFGGDFSGGDFWSAAPVPVDSHDDLLNLLFPEGSDLLLRPGLQGSLTLPMWEGAQFLA